MRDGDKMAFENLYHSYKDRIIAHLLYIFKNDELSQDIAQDTFITLWEKRAEIDIYKSFKSYLFTIATNKAYDLLRKANYDEKLRTALSSFLYESSNVVEEYLYRKEYVQQVEELLSRMPEQQRNVYRMAKIDGYSYEEIAKQFGISRHTVNTHIKRANIFLKQQILNRPEIFAMVMSVLINTSPTDF